MTDHAEHAKGGVYSSKGKEYTRDTNYITDRIVAHPSRPHEWPVDAGRYRLIAARACPWANRTLIVRRLLGLEDAISVGLPGPTHDADSWTFDLDPGGVDPVLGIPRIKDAYLKRFPDYPRGITEADVRLFTTLVRFDPVYHGHFKCNRNKLTEMPALWAYARDLYQTPGFGDTVDFVQIKRHYYVVHTDLNPLSIVPDGPDLSGWLTPHGRESLAGRPFGDGTPPGQVRPGEEVPNPLVASSQQ